MLKDTLSKFFKVDSLLGNLSGYVETRFELLKVEAKEEVAKGLAQAVGYLLIFFILVLFITFLSIALALLLGSAIGNIAGFSVVSGFYLVAGLILWLSREKIISRLERRFAFIFRKKK